MSPTLQIPRSAPAALPNDWETASARLVGDCVEPVSSLRVKAARRRRVRQTWLTGGTLYGGLFLIVVAFALGVSALMARVGMESARNQGIAAIAQGKTVATSLEGHRTPGAELSTEAARTGTRVSSAEGASASVALASGPAVEVVRVAAR